MKTTFTVRHMEKNSIVQDHFDDRVAMLSKHLKHFEDDLIYLHGTLEKNPHKGEFYASLTLYLPSLSIHSRERAEDFGLALSFAFADVVRQLEKQMDKRVREKRRRVR